ncbi:MAG: 3-hydroxyacyl-CoA dehydrogenase family protein [Chitinophagaceae bacterium]
MVIAVLANDVLKKEWIAKGVPANVEVLWCGSVKTLVAAVADVYIDLLFINDKERTAQLSMRSGSPFFINAVEYSGKDLEPFFIRINAWPGFLERKIVEVAITNPFQEPMVKKFFDTLNWNYQLVPDTPGMISARIIATIINEAYYTFGEEISTKEEIDIAMKLGTSYPFGPFEWSEKIGLDKIYNLLIELSKTDSSYSVAPALENDLSIQQNNITK